MCTIAAGIVLTIIHDSVSSQTAQSLGQFVEQKNRELFEQKNTIPKELNGYPQSLKCSEQLDGYNLGAGFDLDHTTTERLNDARNIRLSYMHHRPSTLRAHAHGSIIITLEPGLTMQK